MLFIMRERLHLFTVAAPLPYIGNIKITARTAAFAGVVLWFCQSDGSHRDSDLVQLK